MSAPATLSTEGGEPELRGFLPIALETLASADKLNFDLFTRSETGRTVLLGGRNYVLNEEDIRRLSDSSKTTLYIRAADRVSYCDYLREVVLQSPKLKPPQRLQVLHAANQATFEFVFSSSSVQRYVEFAEKFGRELVEIISNNDIAVTELVKLLNHDYSTYTHVVNVTTYCLALARGLGFADGAQLREIAIGALLHDYGHRHIPKSVLHNTDPLADAKWGLFQQHPLYGFRDLCQRPDLTWRQLMMIYQHHERLDGKGYPVGVEASEVHPWGRLCKVADVFATLTSDRAYRKAEPVCKVAQWMQDQVNVEFDVEMVQCFRAMLNCST
ncbi:MAG: HD-GYP domain-containing protein [Pirellulaceae bacterium]